MAYQGDGDTILAMAMTALSFMVTYGADGTTPTSFLPFLLPILLEATVLTSGVEPQLQRILSEIQLQQQWRVDSEAIN